MNACPTAKGCGDATGRPSTWVPFRLERSVSWRSCSSRLGSVAGRSLDERFGDDSHTVDLRWLYAHMIDEYGRHNGHADLIRELVDGTTGY